LRSISEEHIQGDFRSGCQIVWIRPRVVKRNGERIAQRNPVELNQGTAPYMSKSMEMLYKHLL
jgi:hypothetical protein